MLQREVMMLKIQHMGEEKVARVEGRRLMRSKLSISLYVHNVSLNFLSVIHAYMRIYTI